MNRRNTCILIGSDKGGVGKSLLAQIMISAYDQAKRPLQLVEIDHQRKLASIYKDRVTLSLDAGPTIDALVADRMSGLNFFNRAHDIWLAGDTLTDLGANVSTPLFEWANFVDLAATAEEDNIDYRFVSVASPDEQSLRSAVSSLSAARRALGGDAELFLVLNETSDGCGYRPYENTDLWRRVQALQHSHGVTTVRIPYCGSAVMEWARAFGLTFLDILDPNSGTLDQISAAAGFSRMDRRVHVKIFTSWIQQVQTAMAPLFQRQQHYSTLQAAE